MLPLSTAQEDVLNAAKYQVHVRVEIEDGAGAMQNLCALGGVNWVDRVSWGWNIDQPVPEIRVQLRRDVTGTKSLAPLQENSTLNTAGSTAYSPLLDAGRLLKLFTATSLPGVVPTSSQMQHMLTAEVDEVDWAHSPVQIVGRSELMSMLADRWVEYPRVYGADDGSVVLEDVLQQMLIDHSDLSSTELWVPVPSMFAIREYEQQKMPLLQGFQQLSQLRGWDIRERWSSTAGDFLLKLFEPDRNPSSSAPDWTFGASKYIDVRRLVIARDDIRNAISVIYTDAADGIRKQVTAESTASIGRWRRRWMEIEEASESSISSSSEAQNMADAALADLKDPAADQDIELPYWWPAELQDFYEFTANGRHYSADQQFAVYGITHELSEARQRTNLQVRGRPVGQYLAWQKNARTRRPRDPVEQYNDLRLINFRRVVDNVARTVTLKWNWAGRVQQAWIHEEVATEPEATDIFDGFASQAPDTILDRDTDAAEYVVAFPSSGDVVLVQLEPRDLNLQRGPVMRVVVIPPAWSSVGDIPDGTITASKLIQSAQKFGADFTWSFPDDDTVAWSSATVTLAGSTQYGINSGNTGNMSTAMYYIYLRPSLSATALQATTNPTGVIDDDDTLLMAIASKTTTGSTSPFFVPAVGVLGLTDYAQLKARIVATDWLMANTVTAALINVAQLSAISANLGTVTAGQLNAAVIVASSHFSASTAYFSGGVKIYGGSALSGAVIGVTGGGDGKVEARTADVFTGDGSLNMVGGLARTDLRVNRTSVGGGFAVTDVVAASAWATSSGGAQMGFYGTTPISKQTGVPVNSTGIHAALVALGLIT